MSLKHTTLPAGPLKRVWVNKHVLPQFGGTSARSPVWWIECEGVRHKGHHVDIKGWACCVYQPDDGDGPHAWVETTEEVTIVVAAEEAV